MKRVENLYIATSDLDSLLWKTLPDGFKKVEMDLKIIVKYGIYSKIDNSIRTLILISLSFQILHNTKS